MFQKLKQDEVVVEGPDMNKEKYIKELESELNQLNKVMKCYEEDFLNTPVLKLSPKTQEELKEA